MQLTTQTAYGIPIIVHSTYVWFPVEMGWAGILAVAALVFAMWWTVRGLLAREHDDITVAVVGGIMVVALWIGVARGPTGTACLSLSLQPVASRNAAATVHERPRITVDRT